ncbi:MAG TPA: hypothetical protein VMB21_07365 [Candidatus Limnocylindria bacterium]|nr:hypothetical protein [Candidatus Limnocylindria bacterium]
MTFLPIAVRELLVASRRPTTFRVRLATAGGAALLGFILLAFTGAGARSTGDLMFTTLVQGGFVYALFAGVLLAADCISEEKREGTLGLLFLTDLGGFDIIAGKLLIVGLNALMALLAGLPVAAVAWILGGVTGGEFWRCALVLVNTLFLSLAVGLAVSARRRVQMETLIRTTVWLVAITFGLGLLHRLLLARPAADGWRWWLGVSPWVSFGWAKDLAYRADPGRYWSAVWLAHFLGWAFLLTASWTVRRRWQDAPRLAPPTRALQVSLGADGRSVRVTRQVVSLRTEFLEDQPIAALLTADAQIRLWAWVLVGLAGLLIGGAIVADQEPLLPISFLSKPALLPAALSGLLLLVKTLFAWQACEFFATCRRNGALEALLTTPLTDAEIYRGQWASLRRNFGPPLIVLCVLLAVGPLLQAVMSSKGTGGTFPADQVRTFGIWLYVVINLPLELMAIAWFGMWLALTETRPGWAFAKTVAFVVVLPQILFCVPSLLVAGAVFSYARGKLMRPIRQVLNGTRDPHRYWTKVGRQSREG